MTTWACDASVRETQHIARVALVPASGPGGVPVGTSWIMQIRSDGPASLEAEFLGVLACHILARSEGMQRVRVNTDSRSSSRILDRYRRGVGQRHTDRLPYLGLLVEAMGGELDRVVAFWSPRNSTAALLHADKLASKGQRAFTERVRVRHLPSGALLDMARRLSV